MVSSTTDFFSKESVMKKLTIVTHNGVFHADEVFAIATIRIAYEGAKIKVIRTRNPKEFEKADFVIDVGGKYDGVKFFDHHQRGFDLKRDNGIKYSSFGLIWKLLGEKICDSEKVAKIVDERLVQCIDAVDNGQIERLENVFSISDMISLYNQNWFEEDKEEQTDNFEEAVDIAEIVLMRLVLSSIGIIFAKEILENSNLLLNGKVLMLERFCPWQSHVRNTMPDVLFVLFPDPTGSWRIQAVPENERSFKSRKLLPESWAGLEGEELAKVTGVSDAIFCHSGRFIAGAKTREGIFKMAKLALFQ